MNCINEIMIETGILQEYIRSDDNAVIPESAKIRT